MSTWGKVTLSGIASAEAPNRSNVALFYEEQGLWSTASEKERGKK